MDHSVKYLDKCRIDLDRPFHFICSHGYMPFFRAIQPQLNSLKSFLNFQTPPVSPQHSKMEFRDQLYKNRSSREK